MAKNDTILLDGVIGQRVADALPSNRIDEVFEFLAFEQLLKDYDLSREEIESGWVDGRDDGSIDGFYTFVNGHLVRDPNNFAWPKRHAEIEVWILVCKHHDTFQQQPLNALQASISELFDLSTDNTNLTGSYSKEILESRAIFDIAYRRLSPASPVLSIHFAYVSRGDASAVAENVQARANQVVEVTQSLFSCSTIRLEFVGASELVSLYRRTKKFSIELPVLEYLSRGQSGYVVLTDLEEYARFVTDDGGNLRRYLFDSNVRDFLGSTAINEDILESLRDDSAPDFWWLNNGVTILVTGATVAGKTIHLQDIQIVNGLQTTESIFRHFQADSLSTSKRALLVKIIVSTESTHRDRIIRATNNQNLVEIAGLRATDNIQRNIEEYLERHGWYYERRKNYFQNMGKPPAKFVTPMFLAAGYVALVMKNPAAAVRLKSKFMRHDTYRTIFSDKTSLQTWVVITETLKRAEEALENFTPASGRGDRFLANWRNLIAFIAVARSIGRFSYSRSDLDTFDASVISKALVAQIWGIIPAKSRLQFSGNRPKRDGFVFTCCEIASKEFGIPDVPCVGRQQLQGLKSEQSKERADRVRAQSPHSTDSNLDHREFIDRVDSELPQQPWKPGIHRTVAERLGCEADEVSAAIAILIHEGRRWFQRHGVVYGADGTVIARDPDRVEV
jgi:hypothetical protein